MSDTNKETAGRHEVAMNAEAERKYHKMCREYAHCSTVHPPTARAVRRLLDDRDRLAGVASERDDAVLLYDAWRLDVIATDVSMTTGDPGVIFDGNFYLLQSTPAATLDALGRDAVATAVQRAKDGGE